MDYTIYMIRKVFKTGHSYAVTLSKKLLQELGVDVGDQVAVELDREAGRILIRREHKTDQLSLDLPIRPKLGNARAAKAA